MFPASFIREELLEFLEYFLNYELWSFELYSGKP